MSDIYSNRSILIVEDCADVRSQLQAQLESLGYQVTVAASGNEALETLGAQKFGAVISDIQMPNGTGLVLLEAMRRIGDGTHVIIMTAATDFSKEEIISIGGNGFLRKPININILVSMLESHFANWGNV